MNSNSNDMEKMREAWRSMGECLGMQPGGDSNPGNLNKKKTSLDQLCNRYRVFYRISLVMILVSSLVFTRIGNDWSFYLALSYAVYFLTVFCMDNWLYNGIRAIDPVEMSISDVVSKALYYRKRHLQFMVVLIPMAICLIGFTVYVFSPDRYFINGMVAGAIVGVCIGIVQFRRFMSEYKKLTE